MKKTVIVISILILVCLIGLWAFCSLGRAGGKIGFEATVTKVEGDIIYAAVSRDDAGFGSRKLPDTIVIYAADFPEYEIQIDDQISGCYIRKNYEGNFYRVVSILVNGQ